MSIFTNIYINGTEHFSPPTLQSSTSSTCVLHLRFPFLFADMRLSAAYVTGFISLLSTSTASCLHGTSLYKLSALEKRSSTNVFGYTNRLSPLNWANLAPENQLCSTSKIQSPINLDETIAFATEHPQIEFEVVEEAKLINLGTTIEVEFENGAGVTTFAGQRFEFVQFHFHTPSEHRIGGEYFPVEMHMVHENIGNLVSQNMLMIVEDPSSIAVLAPLFQLSTGRGLPFIDSIVSRLAAIAIPGSETMSGQIELAPAIEVLTNETIQRFTYSGSLTTPPCSEGVTWIIPSEPLPITVDQFNALKSIIKFNSRYTQNKLGDGNLIQIAHGNDSNVDETIKEIERIRDDPADAGAILERHPTNGSAGVCWG